MFIPHTHSTGGSTAQTPHFDWRHPIPLPLIRLAAQIVLVEISVLAAALALWGLMSPRPVPPSLPESAAGDDCRLFGRAGGHCPADDDWTGPASNRSCAFLGRAGRFCPDESR